MTERTIKMRMSFVGVHSNALDALAKLDSLCKCEYCDKNECVLNINTCLSSYHDALLAICKGHVSIEEVKDFFFDDIPVETVEYQGGVITFEAKEE